MIIDPGSAAVLASLVSLLLGTASILRATQESRTSAKREQIQRRAEAYVALLRLVETRGLAVQDSIYNLTETEQDGNPVSLPTRVVEMPPRSDRAEMLALVVAYGTSAMRDALDSWIEALDDWDRKRDGYAYEYEMNGPYGLEEREAEPERSHESIARKNLGVSVTLALRENT